MTDVEVSVSEFVALLNQTLEYAYPAITITGELANFRVSKNRWVYFDLKDEMASVRFFGTVYQLPGPLEDGMLLKVRGQPRLHNLYGFSINTQSIQPAGEGSIRRAADLLKAKLAAEGLFDDVRKRTLPYPPQRIGLITSGQSAAYADFIKIINARWGGLAIEHIDVQVQGEVAPGQIVAAFDQFNAQASPPEVIVLIRGGGSAEDLAAFSTEQVTRAVAASRVPTLVAIGHEVDVSLAELAADRRASTPSNAAELLVPDRDHVLMVLKNVPQQLTRLLDQQIQANRLELRQQTARLGQFLDYRVYEAQTNLSHHAQLLEAFNPTTILQRGYAIVRHDGKAIRTSAGLQADDIVEVSLAVGGLSATVKEIKE